MLASAEECEVVYLTGRPERCRRDTLDWLAAQGLPEGQLFMRRNDDRRPGPPHQAGDPAAAGPGP